MSIYSHKLQSTPSMSIVMEYDEIVILVGQPSTYVFEDDDDSDSEEEVL